MRKRHHINTGVSRLSVPHYRYKTHVREEKNSALSRTHAAIKDGACFSLDASNIARCDAVSMVTVVSSVTPVTVTMAPLFPQ